MNTMIIVGNVRVVQIFFFFCRHVNAKTAKLFVFFAGMLVNTKLGKFERRWPSFIIQDSGTNLEWILAFC